MGVFGRVGREDCKRIEELNIDIPVKKIRNMLNFFADNHIIEKKQEGDIDVKEIQRRKF